MRERLRPVSVGHTHVPHTSANTSANHSVGASSSRRSRTLSPDTQNAPCSSSDLIRWKFMRFDRTHTRTRTRTPLFTRCACALFTAGVRQCSCVCVCVRVRACLIVCARAGACASLALLSGTMNATDTEKKHMTYARSCAGVKIGHATCVLRD